MWDLLLNDEQAMIAASVREYFARELPIERLRPKAPPRNAGEIHTGMAALGWFGVGLPEAAGGAGLDLIEEALVQRECGRYLASPSVMATVLAAHVAYHTGEAALARKIAAGRQSIAMALESTAGESDRRRIFAFDWNPDDLLLYWNDDGMGLFEGKAVIQVQSDEGLDDSITMQAGLLVLKQPSYWVSAKQVPLGMRARVLLAAALAGLAGHVCEIAVEYAKAREQFRKPIGSFQAVKHRCADMAVRARLAWYQTSLAALKLQTGAEDAVLQVSAAKLIAAQAAHENARAAIQIHGAIGFQSECDVHWFLKRAHVYDQLGGAIDAQARQVIAAPAPSW